MILTNARERTRFLRFLAVGVVGASVDFGVMNLLTHGLNVAVLPSGTISFLAAVTSNFLWNRYWTYPDSRSKPIPRQFIEFAIINTMGLIIRVPILAFIDPFLRRFFSTLAWRPLAVSPFVLADNLSLALAIGIVMFWNFFANRYLTYADVE